MEVRILVNGSPEKNGMEMTDKKTDKEYIEFKEAVIKYAMDKKLYSEEENNFAPTRMMLRDGSVKNLTRLQDIYEHLVERYGYEEATKCPIMRIRKLTPRECFRLMDVDDKYIDAIDAYTFEDDDFEKDCLGKEIINTETGKRQKHRIGTQISNSKKYQLAGNSIVVNCMYHIFDNLFVHPSFSDAVKDSVKIDNNGQLSLSFDTDVIGIDEVARILGMSKQSVYNRIEDIPHTKFGKKLRFFKSDIVKMLRR